MTGPFISSRNGFILSGKPLFYGKASFIVKRGILLFSILLSTGCGYHLRGGGDSLPEDVRTISISAFKNNTYEMDLDTLISVALADEFAKSGRLKVVQGENADMVLDGVITSFSSKAVSFSSLDVAAGYRLELVADATLKRREGGELIWKERGVSSSREYQSVPGSVETTEIRKEEAKEAAVRELAEIIYDRVFEGF